MLIAKIWFDGATLIRGGFVGVYFGFCIKIVRPFQQMTKAVHYVTPLRH